MSPDSWVVDPVDHVEYLVPPFASAESTLLHYSRAREGLLWEDDAPEYRLSAEFLGLSEPLREDLRAWQARWQRAVSKPSPAHGAAFWLNWEADGTALVDQIQAVLRLVATIEPEFQRADRRSDGSSSGASSHAEPVSSGRAAATRSAP